MVDMSAPGFQEAIRAQYLAAGLSPSLLDKYYPLEQDTPKDSHNTGAREKMEKHYGDLDLATNTLLQKVVQT